MGVVSCRHNNVYESEEKEIAEKEKKAEEDKKRTQQIEQAIKEKKASKQKVELDNKNLQGEQHKTWNKLQTSLNRNRYVGCKYFASGVQPFCDRCSRTFDNITPDGFWEMAGEFSGGAGMIHDPATGMCTSACFVVCPYCKTNDVTGAIQAKVGTNMSTITNIENTIIEEKSKMQQAEAAYIENSSSAAKLTNTINKGKKAIEEQLKAETRAAEAEEQAAEMKKQMAEVEEQAAKAKKEKIDMVKRMLESNLPIPMIVQISGFSHEEVEKIKLEKD